MGFYRNKQKWAMKPSIEVTTNFVLLIYRSARARILAN